MNGTVFSIEEFSIYDGPGIRTSVFLKGCPLRCTWCHNPEGQLRQAQIIKSPNGCIKCGNCLCTSRLVDGRRIFTSESIEKCPMHLLRVSGEEYSSDELCSKILKNEAILKASGGGVTFSGGEPFLQHEFLFECLTRLSGKIHCAIQTCGFCSSEIFETILSLADYFLYDLKIIDTKLHKKFTGVNNDLILRNFDILANSKKPFVVRIPLIPTVTDAESNIEDIAKLLNKYAITYAELLPYNKMAGGKYDMVGRKYEPNFDETMPCQVREEIFNKYNISVKVL